MRIGKRCTIDPTQWVDSTLSKFKEYFKTANSPLELEKVWKEITKGKKKTTKKKTKPQE